MESEKFGAEDAEVVVGADDAGFGGKDVDGFLHGVDIAGPECASGNVDGEVEAGVAEFFARRGDGEGAVGVDLRAHQDDGVAVGEREDYANVEACVVGQFDEGIGASVEDVLRGEEFADPGGDDQATRLRIPEMENAAAHAAAAVEGREGDVELLEAAAEQEGESVAEGAEEGLPSGPGVELVKRRCARRSGGRKVRRGRWGRLGSRGR